MNSIESSRLVTCSASRAIISPIFDLPVEIFAKVISFLNNPYDPNVISCLNIFYTNRNSNQLLFTTERHSWKKHIKFKLSGTRSIWLDYQYKVTRLNMAPLKGFPIKKLNLSNFWIKDRSWLQNLKNFPLEKLDLSVCELESSELQILERLPLEKLYLCYNMRLENLDSLRHLTRLNSLNLKGNHEIIDLQPLSELVELKKLILNGLSNIYDRQLEHLKRLPLISLDLRGCESLTGEGLRKIRLQFPNTVTINDKQKKILLRATEVHKVLPQNGVTGLVHGYLGKLPPIESDSDEE